MKGKPFFGGIIKPKVGMSPEVLLEAVKEMVYGGVITHPDNSTILQQGDTVI